MLARFNQESYAISVNELVDCAQRGAAALNLSGGGSAVVFFAVLAFIGLLSRN